MCLFGFHLLALEDSRRISELQKQHPSPRASLPFQRLPRAIASPHVQGYKKASHRHVYLSVFKIPPHQTSSTTHAWPENPASPHVSLRVAEVEVHTEKTAHGSYYGGHSQGKGPCPISVLFPTRPSPIGHQLWLKGRTRRPWPIEVELAPVGQQGDRGLVSPDSSLLHRQQQERRHQTCFAHLLGFPSSEAHNRLDPNLPRGLVEATMVGACWPLLAIVGGQTGTRKSPMSAHLHLHAGAQDG
ncbi:uncharacterized protein LOC119309665 [Triticum dicoccoides]|uniref:uncharacterized protein LOC119309665 n=1 Tax=Triticum dicoccoides TaxID=85692 RepID=UPI00189148F5|nr:uncharacterized protein LOC119309665 [Triticum dicoccoides]